MRAKSRYTPASILLTCLACGCATVSIPGRARDEIDELLREVRPPARFKKYEPQFNVRKVTFKWTAFRRKTGRTVEITDERRAIFDGDRMIGYICNRNPVWENIRLFSMHPKHDARIDPEDWADATDFRNYARDYGESIVSGHVYDESHSEIQGGGKTITFVRTDIGRPDGRTGRDIHEVNRVTLSVHPQLGYCLTRTREWRCKPLPKNRHGKSITGIGVGDLWGWGVVNPWPGEGTYTEGFFSHGGSYRRGKDGSAWAPDKKYALYWMNGPSVEGIRHGWHPLVRSGGLVGYLGGRENWGAAMSVVGPSDVYAAVCPAWGEFHAGGADLPSEPDADGYWRLTYTHRLVGLPPEIQDHIRADSKVLFEGMKSLAIRLEEDFEDQPLAHTTPHRTLRFERRGVMLTSARAHSGRQAIVTQGIRPEDLPQVNLHEEHPPVCFDPGHTYHVECWIYVEGDDTEAFVIAANELEIEDATAFARDETIGKSRTPSVKKPGEWRKVEFDFVAPAYGGLLALNFVALGPGKAYFDDFKIRKVGTAGP